MTETEIRESDLLTRKNCQFIIHCIVWPITLKKRKKLYAHAMIIYVLSAVEEQFIWAHGEEFFLIMKKLIDDIIDFEEFETDFTILHDKLEEEYEIFRQDLKQIEKFHPSTGSDRFTSYIHSIYRQFEEVEDEYCTEEEVQDYVKEAYLKF